MPVCHCHWLETKSGILEQHSTTFCSGCKTRSSENVNSSAMRATNFAPLSLLTTELELALRRPRSNPELLAAIRSALAETTDTARTTGGTGLGLAIVDTLSQRNHASVTARNRAAGSAENLPPACSWLSLSQDGWWRTAPACCHRLAL